MRTRQTRTRFFCVARDKGREIPRDQVATPTEVLLRVPQFPPQESSNSRRLSTPRGKQRKPPIKRSYVQPQQQHCQSTATLPEHTASTIFYFHHLCRSGILGRCAPRDRPLQYTTPQSCAPRTSFITSRGPPQHDQGTLNES